MSSRSEEPRVHNAWIGAQGPGAFDLRSDTMTTPTASMLKAIQGCTLLDDVEREDPTTSDLEAHVASLTGKEAGLFVNSGIMGNQLGLRTLLTRPPHGVLCDHRSHIVLYESGGVCFMTGAMPTPVVPKNSIHLTLEDIKPQVVLGDDIHTCPTRVISLENTLNGMVFPLDEVRRISSFAREHGIKMHLDGARLWEAVASGAGTLKEYCSLFDTVTLCFSKGLGAPVGSVLVGTTKNLHHARWIRRAIGGGLRQPGFISAAARVAVDETFGTKGDGSDGWLKTAHDLAQRVEAMWVDKGGKLMHPAHTNMCWLDLDAAGIEAKQVVQAGQEVGLRLLGARIVLHYQAAQHGDEILKRLDRVFTKVLAEATGVSTSERVGRANMYNAD